MRGSDSPQPPQARQCRARPLPRQTKSALPLGDTTMCDRPYSGRPAPSNSLTYATRAPAPASPLRCRGAAGWKEEQYVARLQLDRASARLRRHARAMGAYVHTVQFRHDAARHAHVHEIALTRSTCTCCWCVSAGDSSHRARQHSTWSMDSAPSAIAAASSADGPQLPCLEYCKRYDQQSMYDGAHAHSSLSASLEDSLHLPPGDVLTIDGHLDSALDGGDDQVDVEARNEDDDRPPEHVRAPRVHEGAHLAPIARELHERHERERQLE